MQTIEQAPPLTKYGIGFPWLVDIQRDSNNYSNLDEVIRRCDHDQNTLSDEKVSGDFIKKLGNIFLKNSDISFFVHNSQFMFFPVFCILLDSATPEEYSLLQKVVIRVAKKIHVFDSKMTKQAFIELLYSKENKERLKKYGLTIQQLEAYRY